MHIATSVAAPNNANALPTTMRSTKTPANGCGRFGAGACGGASECGACVRTLVDCDDVGAAVVE